MSLRTRLFLWIGLIFLLAFGVSLYFEVRLTDKNLREAEANLRKQIFEMNEKGRTHIQEYFTLSLEENQAQIDALLIHMSRLPSLEARLFLGSDPLSSHAWESSALLFKHCSWLDFVQTSLNHTLSSLVIPLDVPMHEVSQIPIDEGIAWIRGDRDYIGVNLFEKSKPTTLVETIESFIRADLKVLFDPKTLLALSGDNLPLPLQKAINYLKTHDAPPLEETTPASPSDSGLSCLGQDEKGVSEASILFLQRGDQSHMISALASLFPNPLFGTSPLDKGAPLGIARFDSVKGEALFSHEIFYGQRFYNDEAYFQATPSHAGCPALGGGLAVITSPELDRLFIGNVLHLQKENFSALVTVGIDIGSTIKKLALTLDQTILAVHEGKVVMGYSREGSKLSPSTINFPTNPDILTSTSGTVEWQGNSYYYVQMTPINELDLHFFALNLESEAFAFVRTLDEGTRLIINKLSVNMRVIALFAFGFVLILLHHVARRITRPITKLAEVTEHVAAGKLEDIDLPSAPKGRHDEIAVLCESFEKMVKGLREKEKVKGVLNKVVSPEVAAEILKEGIHLGGEEKKVTVLFADIRQFTQLSSRMAPHEVIEMLNTCMTKVSHVIDEFGGVIDKYVGDEVMALFGAPIDRGDSALKALLCALKMVEVLNSWNEERQKSGLVKVEMGIGIHTGLMLAGNMGAENRLNYTVIGSNVNLAARLCSYAKGMQILISQETLQQPHVQETMEVEALPPAELKGFEEKVAIFGLKGIKHV